MGLRRFGFLGTMNYHMYVISILISVSYAKQNQAPLLRSSFSNQRIHPSTPPKLIDMPQRETTFKDGEGVDLPCVATGDPPPTYKWEKDGKELKMGLEIRQLPGKGTITIEEPRTVHEGIYQCFASNSFGMAASVKTILKRAVLDPFPSVKEPKVHRPKIGSSLTLLCHPPLSYPTGVIYWGENNQSSKLKPIENTERVSLDYKGTLYFSNIEMGDSIEGRSYVCILQNQELRSLVQGDDQRIDPQVGSEPPRPEKPSLMWASDKVEVALKGQTKRMKCIFSGFPTPIVSWVRVGENLQEKVSYSSFGQEIIIPDTDYGDAGTYQCLATNSATGGTPVRHEISLIVESPPYWKDNKPPEDVNTSEEEAAQFDCKAEGRPTPTITWYINGVPLNKVAANRRRIEGADYIRYVNVTKVDTLVIQCNASNKHGYIFANAFLNVFAEPPTFIETPAPVTKVAEGQTAVLTCKAFGAPKPVIFWQRGANYENITTVGRFEVERSGNLRIKNVKLEDHDRYHCNASNKFGHDVSDGQLIVRERTRIVEAPEGTKIVNASSNVVLHCNAVTDPNEKIKIKWLRNGEEIDFIKEATIAMDMKNNSLIITNAKVTDTSIYTCNASNGLDSHSVDVKFVVKGAPDPPYDVRLLSCSTIVADIGWNIGASNNEPITQFLIYQNTSHSNGQFVPATPASVGPRLTSGKVKLQPWTNYTFHVRAVNALGQSEPSNLTPGLCTTRAQHPFRHPGGVCTRSERPDALVIVWKTMPKEEHNGPGFRYEVVFKRKQDGVEERREVRDWTEGKLVVEQQPLFTEYEIYVQAVNDEGVAPRQSLTHIRGYSGQDTPLDRPQGLAVNKATMNSTSAEFTWEPVDESRERVRGFFIGYQIVFWRKSNPTDKRTQDKILYPWEECPQIRPRGRRHRQGRAVDLVRGHTNQLWPYSDLQAGVLVMNGGGQKGELSDIIDFTTPEGVPSVVPALNVIEKGSNHFKLRWTPPVEANGILIGYEIKYVRVPPGIGTTVTVQIDDPTQLQKKLVNLLPATGYIIYIYARTAAGLGPEYFIEDSTLALAPPDKPAIAAMPSGDDYVNVSWTPSTENPPVNPAGQFYIKYRKSKEGSPASGEGETEGSGVEGWMIARPQSEEQDWVNVSNLVHGESYDIIVVATNGGKDETESDVKPVVVGRNEPELVQTNIASTGWFIALLCIIAFLLLILLLLCLIKRNRGGKYAVHEKEKLRGHDSTRDDDEAGFGEYTRTDEPDMNKSKLSVNSEEKPLESETDSLGEYEDPDPMKFNEDGSFIGQYGGKKKDGVLQHDVTTPSALSTFV